MVTRFVLCIWTFHWLPLQQWIIFRIGALVWRCLLGLPRAPVYLRDLCCSTSSLAPEVAVYIAQWNSGYSLFLLLLPPQARPMHSRWLAPLCGMGFLWHSDCSSGFFPTHSALASKLFFLAVRGSGALLSSKLEEALHKSP